MSWAVEQPFVILFIGAFCFALTGAVWIQSRDRRALLAVGSVVVLTGLWILAERLIVTEVEQVKQTIRLIARELQNNDTNAVLSHISASNPALRHEAEAALKLVNVQKVSVKRNLTATVTKQHGTVSAEARFNAVATVVDRSGFAGKQTIPRFVIVRLRNENGQWRVISYELQKPIRRRSGEPNRMQP